MMNINPASYKISQKSANRLYKKLNKELGFFNLKQKILLRESLYKRCKQQLFINNSGIKLRWINRYDYYNVYGRDTMWYFINFLLFGDDDYLGPVYLEQEIMYRNIKRMVYNCSMCRLEIYGKVATYVGDIERPDVFIIYDLLDIRNIINCIQYSTNVELEILK